MGLEFEYRTIIGFITLYIVVIFIGGLMNIPVVENPDIPSSSSPDNITFKSLFLGIGGFLKSPFTGEIPFAVSFFIVAFLISPIAILLQIMSINVLRGR